MQHSEPNAATIEVDPAVLENPDDNSYYDSTTGAQSSTQSLTSSINQYMLENGRSYHVYFGRDKNLMPTDEVEQDRLDMHHEMFLELLDRRLHLAPIENPHSILDVGTGTGIWAIDVADMYPQAEVIGIDLTPIQPAWVPSNCRFEVDDCEKDWTFPADHFDYIHIRNLGQAITNWPKVVDSMLRATKPGGYVEIGEVELVVRSDDDTAGPCLLRYFDLLQRALDELGRPQVEVGAPALKAGLEAAGFVDVKVVMKRQPTGPWPKDPKMKHIGAMVMLNTEQSFESYGLAAFTRILGMDATEALKLCRDCVAEVRNKNHHIWVPFNIVYGRKPEKK